MTTGVSMTTAVSSRATIALNIHMPPRRVLGFNATEEDVPARAESEIASKA
jgi:hypothetical protein